MLPEKRRRRAEESFAALTERLAQMPSLLVALSGGVDSAVLLDAACAARGLRCEAATFLSALHTGRDISDAKDLTQTLGVAHHVIELCEYDVPELMANDVRRCYYCKRYAFQKMQALAEERGLAVVADGTNADDLHVYRPGLDALRELGVCSPLAQMGIEKQTVRDIAELRRLAVHAKPASPCLATRLPYGTPLDRELLTRIAGLERSLQDRGYSPCRCRVHGDIVRTEVPREQFARLCADAEYLKTAKALGFHYVTLDLEGFRSGSMDETIPI